MTPATISPKLAEALFNCHAELTAVIKDAKNPHFRNSYATIHSVIETLKPSLTKHNLFVQQPLISSEKPSHVAIRTIISHVSGESLEFISDMPVEGLTPQKTIAALTYLRRAVLVSTFMLGQEDDDGNAASSRVVIYTPPPEPEAPKVDASAAISEEAKKQGWSKPELIGYISKTFKKGSIEALNREEQIRLFKIVAAYRPDQV